MAAKKTPSLNVIQFPAAAQTEKKKPRKKNLRADGRFCVRITVKENGKSKQIPFYSTISRADAKAKAQEFKERMGFASRSRTGTSPSRIGRRGGSRQTKRESPSDGSRIITPRRSSSMPGSGISLCDR